MDIGQRRQQAGAAVDADHVEPLAGEAAAIKIVKKQPPFGGALRLGEPKVDLLLAAVRQKAGRHQKPGASVRRRRLRAKARRRRPCNCPRVASGERLPPPRKALGDLALGRGGAEP